MRSAATIIALAASATAVEIIGDGVPLIYAETPFPNPPFDGVQYNATIINGVSLNSSNEWPCLTADKYFSFAPSCSRQCLVETFKNATVCPDDDFSCHCTQAGSDDLNFYVIPCLTGGVGGCSEEEIGTFANFVHGGLCPYFKATTHEQAYGKCDAQSDTGSDSEVKPSSSFEGYMPKPTGTRPASSVIRGGYWPKSDSAGKADIPCTTSIQSTWTKDFDGPTTFSHGAKAWTVTQATALTVTDSPMTWTSPISGPGTWAVLEASSSRVNAVIPAQTQQPFPTTSTGLGSAQATTSFRVEPAEFTGAASGNKVVGGIVAAAGAAALFL